MLKLEPSRRASLSFPMGNRSFGLTGLASRREGGNGGDGKMEFPDPIGRGWAFPPAFSKAGGNVRMSDGIENIKESLHILLTTSPGERVMRPSYGVDLGQFVSRPLTWTLLGEITEVAAAAIRRWEPRIDVIDLKVEPAEDGLITIEIEFVARATKSRSNLIFPFYIVEASLGSGG